MLALNDIHIGFSRVGGTTPASREALRSYLLDQFEYTLTSTTETDLLIAGDLFDSFTVPVRDWLATYNILAAWLGDRPGEPRHLTLVAGNHDWSPKGSQVSSFEMLCRVLQRQFPINVTVIGIDHWDAGPESAVLAHCSNQETFDAKLEELLAIRDLPPYLFLHANFDNNFAARADHSLNVTRAQAARFIERGCTPVFAHEHQAREVPLAGGRVVVLGNQWPTSIADCLNNDFKVAICVLEDGSLGGTIVTWSNTGEHGYREVNWRELDDLKLRCVFEPDVEDSGAPLEYPPKFIRVSGEATAAEGAAVISAISKFRQKSDAFVITNAVSIDGVVQVEAFDGDEFSNTVEKIVVWDFMKQHLGAEEISLIESLKKLKEPTNAGQP